MTKRPATNRRGRTPKQGSPLKVLLAPTSEFAPAAQVLKRNLDDESAMLGCSLSEYVVRILLTMKGNERVARARGAIT